MTVTLDNALMGEVSKFIAERMGLHFPEERWPYLADGLKTAAPELGFEDAEACARWLITRQPTVRQIETLASFLTVGETYFFRDPASFQYLEQEILPRLVASRAQAGRTLRLWSAGCCSGEEAYSLAITCMRSVPKLDEWNVSVLATDINPRFLAKADAGVYSDWSFRGTPDWVKERFFSPMPDRKMAIKPEVRRLVQFSFLNLARDIYPSLHNQTNAMDVIFCRNVLMYLTSGHQRTVVAALHRCLVDGGILLVNPAEATPALFPMFAVENRDGIILFRKTSQPTHPEPRPVFVASVPLPVVPAIEPVFQAPREPSAPVASSPREVPPPPPASFETATRLFAEGDWDAAEAQLTQIAQVEPDRARSLLLLARIHANQGRLDDALTLCQRAIVTERTNPSAYFLFATICNELGQLEEAIAAQNKALYLDQDFILAHHALSGLYKRLGKQKQARRHLSVALDLLSARSKGEIVPESDGMTCGRLVEAVRAMKGE